MSPIIELQRRMVEAGRIRSGDKGDKGEPRKLDKWRLTSKDEQRLQQAAELWGGTVRAWPAGEGYELYTDTAELPIMLLPGQQPTTWYELWSKGGCQRRCDGAHEIISDSACLCGDERECKPTTRLSVLLPDLPGIGSWLLSSTGWNAASELAGAADLLQRASAQGVLMPARLRLEQRVDVKEGKTRRYAVPVIDIDVSFRELMGGSGQRELPAGYTPIPPAPSGAVTLEQGLAEAGTRQPVRTPRVSLPEDDDILEDEGDTNVWEPDKPSVTPEPVPDEDPEKHTGAQTRKLNVLVGTLRDAGRVSTEQLWAACARGRSVDVDTMIELLQGRDEQGGLHWSPLRDSLTKHEASGLIDWLERRETA